MKVMIAMRTEETKL